MHVFIDTNIILNFFHFSKDDLDTLSDVFATHEHGSATVYLTDQIQDEFFRNREGKIRDALKQLEAGKIAAQLPSFMKHYEEYNEIITLARSLQKKKKAIIDKAARDIASQNLQADLLVKELFEKSRTIETTEEIYDEACRRVRIGNPPGKNHSIGDAINWTILIKNVPQDHVLHVVSEDGDFYSQLDDKMPHPFLEREWLRDKNSQLRVYRTLTEFLEENFDGVAFSYDRQKDALINQLLSSGSYAATHQIIAKLESYQYFSRSEVERILEAAADNGQLGDIIADTDVSDFLYRVASPRQQEIVDRRLLEIIKSVEDDQFERLLE